MTDIFASEQRRAMNLSQNIKYLLNSDALMFKGTLEKFGKTFDGHLFKPFEQQDKNVRHISYNFKYRY